MRRHFSQKIIFVLFIFTIVLSACSPKPSAEELEATMQTVVAQTLTAAPTSTPRPTFTPTITPTLTPTPVIVSYGPTDFPDNVNPLTGLKVDDPSILNRRPVMVKVANYPVSGRPHAGLSSADIVFDYYIGNGANRFVGLFYGQDAEQVGPVRSGRLVDSQLVRMYGGILAMESAYESVYNSIMASLGGLVVTGDHCNDGYQAICRLGDNPRSETSAFANTAEMTKYYASRSYATNEKQNLEGMAFTTIPPEGGVDAKQFTMHYGKNNNALWVYDETTGKYLRYIDEVDADGYATMIPLVDRNTGEQLAFSNIVVVYSDLNTLNGDADSIHEYSIAGRSGRAMIFRDGKMYDVFYKAYDFTPISFIDENKNPVPLQPGNTWMHLTGVYSKVEQDANDPAIWMVSLRKNS